MQLAMLQTARKHIQQQREARQLSARQAQLVDHKAGVKQENHCSLVSKLKQASAKFHSPMPFRGPGPSSS